MTAKWMAVAACAMALLGATPAAAKITITTITGVVRNASGEAAPGVKYGFDYQGLFGAAGADLRGQQYTATFVLDDQTPGATFTEEPGSYSRISGSFGNSPVQATIKIGAGVLSIGDYGGEAYRSVQTFGLPINTVNQILMSAMDMAAQDPNGFSRIVSLSDGVYSNNPFTQSPAFDVPVDYQLTPADFNVGSLFVYKASQFENVFQQAILLTPQHIKVEVAAVPEPAAWGLLILGFAAVGGALRRGRLALA